MFDQLGSPDPEASDQAMMAILAANRLRPLLPKLQVRYEQVHEREQAAAWLAERKAAWLAKHDVVKRERDALAEEWREVYPDAARKIADLVVRTAANNEALAELHRDRPGGVEQHLVSAELHARGRATFSRDTPSLLSSVYLFDWDSGAAGQRADQQRHGDYLARLSREQEERENAEARQLFAESQAKIQRDRKITG